MSASASIDWQLALCEYRYMMKNVLRLFRDKQGLSQRDAAALIGTSSGYWCDLETSRRAPSPKLAIRIEQATGIPREQLRPDLYTREASQ